MERAPLRTSRRAAVLVALATLALAPEARPQDAAAGGAGRSYAREDGRLYRLDGHGRFAVDPEVISARFVDGVAGLEHALALAPDLPADVRALTVVRVNRLGIHDLRLPPGADLFEVLLALRATGLCRYAEENTLGRFLGTPDDPEYGEQWALRNTGQSGGTPGADIEAEPAWALTTGAPSVVAILDSGTEVAHPDLAGNVWVNAGEVPGNGLDDDGNGFVDDVNGWDFENDDGDVSGPFFHGTFVAGVVAARTNNATGVAGVAGGWAAGGGTGLMPLRVGAFAPVGAVIDDALLYAADHGAHVVNLSVNVGRSQAIDDALLELHDNRGVLLVGASGNDGSQVKYPASHPLVMAVGATGRTDQHLSTSSLGPELEVAAPGSEIRSLGLGGSTTISTGTSFACAHAAGVGALLRSTRPGFSNEALREILRLTAEDVDDPGFDERTGWGRINAFQAVQLALASDCNGNGVYDPEDLAAGTSSDTNGNGVPDECELGTALCFGDGTGTPCPCGNDGAAGEGCVHSGGHGMRIGATGSRSLALDALVVVASEAPHGNTGIFYCGTASLEPGNPLYDGLQCAGGDVRRFRGLFQVDGTASDTGFVAQDPSGIYFVPGVPYHFQYWTRDAAGGPSPCGLGANLSPAFAVVFEP